MYNEQIEALISAALADGMLTEKEKQILFKKAQSQGIDLDEFEMVLDARLVELEKAEKAKAAASAPKSNAAYLGIDKALSDVRNVRIRTVPLHLKDAHYSGAKELEHGIGYKYAHDYKNHYVKQQYLPDELKDRVFYELSDNGYEKHLKEHLERIKREAEE